MFADKSIIAYNQSMLEKNKNIAFYLVVMLILICGVALRILFYSYARPFWNDESALAINLTDRSFLELFLPLSHEQVTPPLYAVLCKWIGDFIPVPELAFRLPALIFGIGSIPLFFLLSKKLLNNSLGIVLANTLFALNYQLIYYSQELKQYSCDVFCFLAILLAYFYIDFDKPDKKQLLLISIVCAFSVWLSYTSVFAIFILFILALIKNKKTCLYIVPTPVVSSMALGVLVLKYASDTNLHSFWQDGFIAKNFSNFFNLIFNNMVFYFPDLSWKLVVVLMFLAGMIYLFKTFKTGKSLILILPIVLALALSYFNIYPLYTRTALYLLPIVFLVMSKVFDFEKFCKKFIGIAFGTLLIVVFAYSSFKTDFEQVIQKKYYRETTPQLLSLFQKSKQLSDILVIPHLSAINYEYYSHNFKIDSKKVIVMRYELYEYEKIKTVYDMLPSGYTYKILVTHSGDKNLELGNLKKYVQTQKDYSIVSDDYDNALLSFKK